MPVRLVSVFALLVALFVTACGSDGSTERAGPTPVTVETATAEATPRAQVGRYRGTVRGTRRVPLSTKIMGTVTQLEVEEGDRVQAGETLVRIRSQNVEAQRKQVEARLREARSTRDNAEKQFERIQSLREEESATEKEYDDAQTAYERAQAQVRALESQLEETEDMLSYATVEAPLDGFVVEKRSEEGALAAPGQPLLVVETLDVLKVVAQVPEQDVNRFSVGDSVDVVIGAAGNEQRRGIVRQINPAGHYASRQFTVQVQLPSRTDGRGDASTNLKSGMYAQVQHRSGTESALTVPERALVERGQLTGLYAVRDGRALLRWVRTGGRQGGRVEVLSGLKPGETYVTDATPRITDGAPVQTE